MGIIEKALQLLYIRHPPVRVAAEGEIVGKVKGLLRGHSATANVRIFRPHEAREVVGDALTTHGETWIGSGNSRTQIPVIARPVTCRLARPPDLRNRTAIS